MFDDVIHLHSAASRFGAAPVLAPASTLPVVRVLTTDTEQTVLALALNRVGFFGNTSEATLLTLVVDGHRRTLRIPALTSAEETARLVQKAVPPTFHAERADNILTVFKRSESLEIAA